LWLFKPRKPWLSPEPLAGMGLGLGVALEPWIRVKAGDGGKEPKSKTAW
jgi:hypothetical protein